MFANTRSWTVEWGDCDPAGIVFFPRFWAAFDTSTARLIEAAAGQPMAEIYRENALIGFPMVDMSARFLHPATYGDTVEIASRVTRLGRSSMGIEHRLIHGETLCIEANEVRVWAGARADGTPGIESRAIPPALAKRLANA
jgi:4-hydroxybenzoyl-CoA thioesterase